MESDLIKRLRSHIPEFDPLSDAMHDMIEAADEIERLTKLISDCEIYLKDGETPRQRMDRDNADVLGLIKQLAEVKTALTIAREDALREAAAVVKPGMTVTQIERAIMYLKKADSLTFLAQEGQRWDAAPTMAEASQVVMKELERKHYTYMASKGRDPSKYNTQYSVAAETLRSMLAGGEVESD